ncbi:MAG: terminase small subunit [Oceanospirillaceae bacterium]|nr:terminase small subunit [Oceanospirillaceae bacterium]
MLVHDFNATAAYKAAGGTAKHADRAAGQIYALPEVKARIEELKAQRSERTKIDADYVLNRHYEIDQMDFIDILNDDLSFKSIHEWPKVFRQFIGSFELAELYEGRGDDREIAGVLKKIKWPDKLRNLELLGKHTSVQAYSDKVELEVGKSLAELMKEVAEE